MAIKPPGPESQLRTVFCQNSAHRRRNSTHISIRNARLLDADGNVSGYVPDMTLANEHDYTSALKQIIQLVAALPEGDGQILINGNGGRIAYGSPGTTGPGSKSPLPPRLYLTGQQYHRPGNDGIYKLVVR